MVGAWLLLIFVPLQSTAHKTIQMGLLHLACVLGERWRSVLHFGGGRARHFGAIWS